MRRFLVLAVLAAACGPSIRVARDASVPIRAGGTWAWGASGAGERCAGHQPMVDTATARARWVAGRAVPLVQCARDRPAASAP